MCDCSVGRRREFSPDRYQDFGGAEDHFSPNEEEPDIDERVIFVHHQIAEEDVPGHNEHDVDVTIDEEARFYDGMDDQELGEDAWESHYDEWMNQLSLQESIEEHDAIGKKYLFDFE
jgi:hypothetical protein